MQLIFVHYCKVRINQQGAPPEVVVYDIGHSIVTFHHLTHHYEEYAYEILHTFLFFLHHVLYIPEIHLIRL